MMAVRALAADRWFPWVAKRLVLVCLGFWLVATLVVGRVLIWPQVSAATIETTHTLWLPVTHVKVEEIRNFFRQPGKFLSGESGGIALTELRVSKKYFQEHQRELAYTFVSVERCSGCSTSLVARYLGKESLEATHVYSYQEPVSKNRFGYRIDSWRFEGETLNLVLKRDWVEIIAFWLSIALGLGLVTFLVWVFLGDWLLEKFPHRLHGR